MLTNKHCFRLSLVYFGIVCTVNTIFYKWRSVLKLHDRLLRRYAFKLGSLLHGVAKSMHVFELWVRASTPAIIRSSDNLQLKRQRLEMNAVHRFVITRKECS